MERNKALFKGPFLEVGSRDYGSTEKIRTSFPGETYVGVDMQAGEGVDLVVDLTMPFSDVDALLGGNRFGTIFCLSVLEHCEQPFLVAENISRLLAPQGVLYVSVPHAWKFHGYPSDYWRFTHEGVKKLFPQLTFDMNIARVSTDVEGDLRPVNEDISRLRISGKWFRKRDECLKSIGADVLAMAGRIGLFRWLTQHRYLVPPTMIEMVGVKPRDSQQATR
ncbi:class I SAM-dependent methyltransferase [Azoarcus taiwanensis]|uniref:Methyltransferase type 11 n=2 Tax=Azoarcus taiwanensis TaxID=666964 RepID=A0A972FF60_9RHOO|nr:class I SAM-dependent methyltransferase [Azoarcus taiwanensis]NMG04232.1 hypothetical protein [Azoarcus taiwanensis]